MRQLLRHGNTVNKLYVSGKYTDGALTMLSKENKWIRQAITFSEKDRFFLMIILISSLSTYDYMFSDENKYLCHCGP